MVLRSASSILLPRSGWRTADDPSREQQQNADIASIDGVDWSKRLEVGGAESDRISGLELDRRKSADTKAATYFALVTAATPLLLAIQTALWEGKSGPAPIWISLSIVMGAMLYLVLTGLHLFRAVAVDKIYRVDIQDVVIAAKASSEEDAKAAIIREKFVAVRLDRDRVNRKFSYVNAAQRSLYNAALLLALLMLVNVIWYLVGQALGTNPRKSAAPLSSPFLINVNIPSIDVDDSRWRKGGAHLDPLHSKRKARELTGTKNPRLDKNPRLNNEGNSKRVDFPK